MYISLLLETWITWLLSAGAIITIIYEGGHITSAKKGLVFAAISIATYPVILGTLYFLYRLVS